jgi:uncharacterized protein YjdB
MQVHLLLRSFAATCAFAFALLFASCAEPVTPSLDLTPTPATLVAGQPLQLKVTRKFPGGAVEDVTNRVTYTTSDRSIATVSGKGEVTAGTEAGPVIIKVFDNDSDASALASITVVASQIASIAIVPSPAIALQSGEIHAFTATATLNDGTTRDVTTTVLWSSTNEAAAVVGNTQLDQGVVRAVAPGDASILATDAATHVQGRSVVFVTGGAPILQAILVTPNPSVVAVGQTAPFEALGIYSDGTNKNLTTSVTWSSSRTDVASVDGDGVVTGVVAGDTTITATGPEPETGVKGSAAAKVVP